MPSPATIVEMPILFEGDDVTINHPSYPGTYVVHKVKRSRAVVKRKGHPMERGLDPDMTMLTKVGTRSPEDIAAASSPVLPSADMAAIVPGAIVRIPRGFRTYTPTTLMVVAKVNASTVTLHRLGGDQPGERGVNHRPAGLVVVDPAEVLTMAMAG